MTIYIFLHKRDREIPDSIINDAKRTLKKCSDVTFVLREQDDDLIRKFKHIFDYRPELQRSIINHDLRCVDVYYRELADRTMVFYL